MRLAPILNITMTYNYILANGMPGFPPVPAAEKMDYTDEGHILGLN